MVMVTAVLLTLPVLASAPARAVTPSEAAACRAECGVLFADLLQNPPPVRICVARCEVRRDVLGARGPTGLTAMPNPVTPWTRVAANARPPAHGNPGGRGMAGRGTAPAPIPLALAAAPPAASGGFMAAMMGAQAATPASVLSSSTPRVATSLGAIYLAAAPSRAFGIAVGGGATAHRDAEEACRTTRGARCAVAAEFTARCAAVAHGMRGNGGVMMTAHPSTFTVTAASFGTGETRGEAERIALAGCTARSRGGECRLTEARCTGG